MDVRVRTAAGDGFDLLLVATAVADDDWRGVFTHGPRAYDDARRGRPRAGARRGTPGQVRLDQPGQCGRLAARTVVGAEAPRRRDRDVARAAARRRPGRPAPRAARPGRARRPDLRGRGRSRCPEAGPGGGLVAIAPWLLRASSREVSETCLRVLRALPPPTGSPDTAVVEHRRGEVGGAALIEQVAPGVSYGPAALAGSSWSPHARSVRSSS